MTKILILEEEPIENGKILLIIDVREQYFCYTLLWGSCILLHKIGGLGANCGRIYKSRLNWHEWVFDKNKIILDLKHCLSLTLLTI